MLNFRSWLETTEPVRHPKNVARRWKGRMPVEGGQNEKAISDFVGAMALEDLNRDLLDIVQHRRAIHEVRYNEPIDGNLIHTQTGKLGNAWGIVAWPEPAYFGFFLEGKNKGNLEIKHPPVIFGEQDKHLLEGIMWHELRHAMDWATGSVHYRETPGRLARFDMGKYAQHILEARAYADQLRRLASKTNQQEVMRLLASQSIFSLNDQLLDTARAFLNMMTNESVAGWLAPAVTAASLMLPAQHAGIPEQPATSQMSTAAARDVAQILGRFFELFLFRNFLL
jgi:hypothetical protein